MLDRCLRILLALSGRDLAKSDLQEIVLRPDSERFTWSAWQPALGLLRQFGLVLVRDGATGPDPVYHLAPEAQGVDTIEALKRCLYEQARRKMNSISNLQRNILIALVDEGGCAGVEAIRRRLRFDPDRGWEQVYQALADLAAMNLLVELSQLPKERPMIRLTTTGWVTALEQHEG